MNKTTTFTEGLQRDLVVDLNKWIDSLELELFFDEEISKNTKAHTAKLIEQMRRDLLRLAVTIDIHPSWMHQSELDARELEDEPDCEEDINDFIANIRQKQADKVAETKARLTESNIISFGKKTAEDLAKEFGTNDPSKVEDKLLGAIFGEPKYKDEQTVDDQSE